MVADLSSSMLAPVPCFALKREFAPQETDLYLSLGVVKLYYCLPFHFSLFFFTPPFNFLDKRTIIFFPFVCESVFVCACVCRRSEMRAKFPFSGNSNLKS